MPKQTKPIKNYGKEKGKKTTKNKKAANVESSSEEEEYFCLVCTEPFSAIRKKKEEWIQCQACSKWSHIACTAGNPFYICHNCDSDLD